MTKEESKKAGLVMIGWANGKTIQWRRRDQNEWHEIYIDSPGINLSWDWDEFDYRVKPEPKLRPWTADEVPLGAYRIIERELNAANERIKRLEEAGDAMFIRSTRVGREIWTKAKEDKP